MAARVRRRLRRIAARPGVLFLPGSGCRFSAAAHEYQYTMPMSFFHPVGGGPVVFRDTAANASPAGRSAGGALLWSGLSVSIERKPKALPFLDRSANSGRPPSVPCRQTSTNATKSASSENGTGSSRPGKASFIPWIPGTGTGSGASPDTLTIPSKDSRKGAFLSFGGSWSDNFWFGSGILRTIFGFSFFLHHRGSSGSLFALAISFHFQPHVPGPIAALAMPHPVSPFATVHFSTDRTLHASAVPTLLPGAADKAMLPALSNRTSAFPILTVVGALPAGTTLTAGAGIVTPEAFTVTREGFSSTEVTPGTESFPSRTPPAKTSRLLPIP
jgi:hypothetical protein